MATLTAQIRVPDKYKTGKRLAKLKKALKDRVRSAVSRRGFDTNAPAADLPWSTGRPLARPRPIRTTPSCRAWPRPRSRTTSWSRPASAAARSSTVRSSRFAKSTAAATSTCPRARPPASTTSTCRSTSLKRRPSVRCRRGLRSAPGGGGGSARERAKKGRGNHTVAIRIFFIAWTCVFPRVGQLPWPETKVGLLPSLLPSCPCHLSHPFPRSHCVGRASDTADTFFKIMPRFKVRSEGDVVRINDQVRCLPLSRLRPESPPRAIPLRPARRPCSLTRSRGLRFFSPVLRLCWRASRRRASSSTSVAHSAPTRWTPRCLKSTCPRSAPPL